MHTPTKKFRTEWTIDDKVYVIDNNDGTWTISHWHRLSKEDMLNMITTLREVLTDEAARRAQYSSDV